MDKIIHLGFFLVMFIFFTGCLTDNSQMAKTKDYNLMIEKGTEAYETGNFEEMYSLALPFAKAGDPEAQFAIGLTIASGVVQEYNNYEKEEVEKIGLFWIRKAAINGVDRAAIYLANSYSNGWTGLPKDIYLSKCWRKSAGNVNEVQKCIVMEEQKGIEVRVDKKSMED